MGRYKPISLTVFIALLLVAAGLSCSEEEKGEKGATTGGVCHLHEDCPSGRICNHDEDKDTGWGACEKCKPCEAQSDCPDERCDAARSCCIRFDCTKDPECRDPNAPLEDEPHYCLDNQCLVKHCKSHGDCSAQDICLDENGGQCPDEAPCSKASCTRRRCVRDEDCESLLCDTASYQCMNCRNETDCSENMRCIGGNCVPLADGDGTVTRLGCTEFMAGCLYDRLSCFDKIGSPYGETFISCNIEEGEGDAPVYTFHFSDGSEWVQFGLPPTRYLARTGEFCYTLIPNASSGEFEYWDRDETEMHGTLSINLSTMTLEIDCPGSGGPEYYDVDELRDTGCSGYQEPFVYTPPPPGIEACDHD